MKYFFLLTVKDKKYILGESNEKMATNNETQISIFFSIIATD